jgi:5-methylcytosine-specific restriction endonuclease McrA
MASKARTKLYNTWRAKLGRRCTKEFDKEFSKAQALNLFTTHPELFRSADAVANEIFKVKDAEHATDLALKYRDQLKRKREVERVHNKLRYDLEKKVRLKLKRGEATLESEAHIVKRVKRKKVTDKIRDATPKRKAQKKIARAKNVLPSRPGQTANFTSEQRAKAAEATRMWRENNKTAQDWSKRHMWYPKYMKKKNMQETGKDIGGLQVECDLQVFLQAIFNLECAYCGTNDSEVGIDRIDPSGIYELSNIIPACYNCNHAKSTLTTDQFVSKCAEVAIFKPSCESSNCFYCGSGERLSVDRLDSSIGYQDGNVVPACSQCNYMKCKLSVEVFRAMCHQVADHKQDIVGVQQLVSDIHSHLKNEHSLMPAPVSCKPSTTFADFDEKRDSSDAKVIRVGSGKSYHTIPTNTDKLCLKTQNSDGRFVRKRLKGHVKEVHFSELLSKGVIPCKRCRKSLTQLEHKMLFEMRDSFSNIRKKNIQMVSAQRIGM